MHRDETLAEEFARLTKEYHTGDEDTKPEAWNLLADFAVDNATVITAALSEQTLPVRVGALEWEKTLDRYKGSERREQWMAKTPWGGLYIWHYQFDYDEVARGPKFTVGSHQTPFEPTGIEYDTLEAAKAAAQSDYETRIRSALVDVPSVDSEPVATGWNLVKGLENGSLALGDDMKPYRAHPPRSALVNAQADADVVESLDARMKAAGMYTVAEMMGVTPLTKWMSNPAINTIEAFSEWLDRKVSEYLRMKAAYDLGDKDESDELYEWVQAHAAVFSTIRDQFQVVRSSGSAEVGSASTSSGVGADVTNHGSKTDLHPEYVTADAGTNPRVKSDLHPGYVPPGGDE